MPPHPLPGPRLPHPRRNGTGGSGDRSNPADDGRAGYQTPGASSTSPDQRPPTADRRPLMPHLTLRRQLRRRERPPDRFAAVAGDLERAGHAAGAPAPPPPPPPPPAPRPPRGGAPPTSPVPSPPMSSVPASSTKRIRSGC